MTPRVSPSTGEGSSVQNAITFHDSIANSWEAGYQESTFSVRLKVLSSLIERGDAKRKWLDAGCGTGTLSRWLSRERGFSVTAIDASEEMLRNAAPERRVEYRKADVTRSGLPEGSFDGVVCSSVLEYLPAVEDGLRAFHGLLKPGGTLIASVPSSAPSVRVPMRLLYWLTRPLGRKRWYSFLDHSKHSFSPRGFAEVLGSCGFVVERTVRYGPVDLPFGMRLPSSGTLIVALARKR